MMNEPTWKQVLNWATVVFFFATPLIFFVFHVSALENWKEGEFKYLVDFQRSLTILVAGLAGLRTWENIKVNGSKK